MTERKTILRGILGTRGLGGCPRRRLGSVVPEYYTVLQQLKDLAEPFHHLQTRQAIPLIFVVGLSEASFKIPKMCYEACKSFIALLIPWDYSQDAFLPKPEDPEGNKVDKFAKAWACMKAPTYPRMAIHARDYPKQMPEEEAEAKQDHQGLSHHYLK